jgi:predicted esterase
VSTPHAIVLAALGLAAVYVLAEDKSKSKKKCPSNRTFNGLPYSELVVGGADPSKPLPLIIGFHGLGGLGKHVIGMLKSLPGPARIIAPDGFLPYGKAGDRAWWAHRSVTPDQDALEADMRVAAKRAKAFIDEAARCFPTVGKPIIVGHSQGGMMAAALASMYPNLGWSVASGAWLPSGLQNRNIGRIIFIHGAGDSTVPFARTREMVASLDSPNVIWLEVSDGAHGFEPLRPQMFAATQAIIKKYA